MQKKYSSSEDEILAVTAILETDWNELTDLPSYNQLTLDSKEVVLKLCQSRIQAHMKELDNDRRNEVEGIEANYD